jgi:hypothetical protein
MLPGFNTNVRHRGVLFHVQSEDSGRAHPHIITHLYHGGTILFSEKSSYAELLDAPDLGVRVRERMEAQHRAVLGRLRAGAFDEAIRERLGAVLEDADTRGSTRPTTPASPGETPAPAGETTAPRPAGSTGTPVPAAPAADPARPFGEGIVSAKPLDEVILEYLVENARKRRQKPAS